MPIRIPKIPTVKKVKQFAEKPENILRFVRQLFPLGQGGLRPEPKDEPYDFLKDISVPYSYQSQYPGFQTPIFGEPLGEPEPYLEPKDRPPSDKPKESKKEKDKTGYPQPPYETPSQPPEIPRPDDLVEDVPPVHPVEESDEAEDEGEPKERRIPRRRSPDYDIWSCEGQEYYLGIPCSRNAAQISIQTQNASKLRKSAKSSKSSQWYNPDKKNSPSRPDYTRYNLSRLGQSPNRRPTPMYRSTRRRTSYRWHSNRRRTSLFKSNWY